jgi:hypothetical protein
VHSCYDLESALDELPRLFTPLAARDYCDCLQGPFKLRHTKIPRAIFFGGRCLDYNECCKSNPSSLFPLSAVSAVSAVDFAVCSRIAPETTPQIRHQMTDLVGQGPLATT